MRNLRLLPTCLLASMSVSSVALSDEPVPPSPIDARNEPLVDDAMLVPVAPAQNTVRSLREGLRIAMSGDVDLTVNRFEIERARGLERQALAAALPIVTASGTGTVHLLRSEGTIIDPTTGEISTGLIPESPTLLGNLSIRQPVIAARAWWGIGTAGDTVALTELSGKDRQRTLTAQLADAVVNVVTAERLSETSRVSLKATLGRLALEKRRLELGAGTALNVVRFQQEVAASRSAVIDADERIRKSREALGLLLGTPDGWGVSPELTLVGVKAEVQQSCKGGDIKDRSDLRVLEAQRNLSQRKETDADLQYVPTLDFVSTTSLSSTELANRENIAWTLQGVLTVPIWDGGARYGARRIAEAEVSQATARIEGATRRARVEVSQTDRGILVAQQALAVAKESRDLAVETDRLSIAGFEAGSLTSFDLVDASRRRREAEINLTLKELELSRAELTRLLTTSTCEM